MRTAERALGEYWSRGEKYDIHLQDALRFKRLSTFSFTIT